MEDSADTLKHRNLLKLDLLLRLIPLRLPHVFYKALHRSTPCARMASLSASSFITSSAVYVDATSGLVLLDGLYFR
ncbi:unnamed protein product [Allacma fusca]|uniref:Uncharacterized protein n=1 Tax=Allacma fusca TaxID=39272 RepID=A0A8J2KG07_9HEXA|nr:unnamed protein product [Allacma fusca]